MASAEPILNEVNHPTFSYPSGHTEHIKYNIREYIQYGVFIILSNAIPSLGTKREGKFYSVYTEGFLSIYLFIELILNDCSYLAEQYCGCMFNYFSGSMWLGDLFSIYAVAEVQKNPFNRHSNSHSSSPGRYKIND